MITQSLYLYRCFIYLSNTFLCFFCYNKNACFSRKFQKENAQLNHFRYFCKTVDLLMISIRMYNESQGICGQKMKWRG